MAGNSKLPPMQESNGLGHGIPGLAEAFETQIEVSDSDFEQEEIEEEESDIENDDDREEYGEVEDEEPEEDDESLEEDDEDEELEEGQNETAEKLKKQLSDAQEYISTLRGEKDSLRDGLNKLQKDFAAFKNEIEGSKKKSEVESFFSKLEDSDELMTGAEMAKALKVILAQQGGQPKPQNSSEGQDIPEQEALPRDVAWVRERPDLKQVNEFIAKHQVQLSSDMDQIQAYYHVKGLMEKAEQAKKKRKRKPVPKTGGYSAKSAKRAGAASELESGLSALANSHGFKLDIQ